MSKIRKCVLVGGAAAVTVSLALGSALADPPSGVTPHHTDIVGTGSDTTMLTIDKLTVDYNKTHKRPARQWYSFDAIGTTTIREKKGCALRTRPNGSGAGIAELEANLRPSGDTSDWCVDFARSSRPRATTDPSSIVFIPFAIDAVTWSADMLTGRTNAPTGLSTRALKAIYSCDAGILKSGLSGPVTWNEVGGTGTHAVIPVIPQSSSGTRAFFLASIGVTTLGSCVKGQDNTVEENEGTNAIFKTRATAPNIVFPYSVAVYLAQSQNGHGTGDQGKQSLRRVNGFTPTKGTKGHLTLNTRFPYSREVFNVVRNTTKQAGKRAVPTYLRPIFGNGTIGTGWVCTNAASKADIKSFGFALNPRCGVLE